jgi:hypothetical protein
MEDDDIWCPHGIDREQVECEECEMEESGDIPGTGEDEDE